MSVLPSRCAELPREEHAENFPRSEVTSTTPPDDREEEDDTVGPSGRRRGGRLGEGSPIRADGDGDSGLVGSGSGGGSRASEEGGEGGSEPGVSNDNLTALPFEVRDEQGLYFEFQESSHDTSK